jgi:hypothetical protein
VEAPGACADAAMAAQRTKRKSLKIRVNVLLVSGHNLLGLTRKAASHGAAFEKTFADGWKVRRPDQPATCSICSAVISKFE